ncbi:MULTISPECIES: hypothetical protein [unclassified Clostridium]|uniref:hypothetical protein n=1 Tax=unclassified Clostridium TaxID=2614128 RepID=UPI0025C06A16|nr:MULTISPECIES: hypothetical protein [unclassified Clostridium]
MDYNKKFEKLKLAETFEIEHPELNIRIVISRKMTVEKILNIATAMYSVETAQITYKSDDKRVERDFWLHHPDTHYSNLNKYIELLLSQDTYPKVEYISCLISKDLDIGSRIQLENGQIGEMIAPDNITHWSCLRYKIIKKNGELGKQERNLYGNTKFTKLETL